MKKLLAVALALCLLVPCAGAEINGKGIEDFFVYASVFGLDDLSLKNAEIDVLNSNGIGKTVIWNIEECRIILTFDNADNLNGGMISGKGDLFLAACAALISGMDETGKYNDYGDFLSCYLLAASDTQRHYGTLSNGIIFYIEKGNTYYTFMI